MLKVVSLIVSSWAVSCLSASEQVTGITGAPYWREKPKVEWLIAEWKRQVETVTPGQPSAVIDPNGPSKRTSALYRIPTLQFECLPTKPNFSLKCC